MMSREVLCACHGVLSYLGIIFHDYDNRDGFSLLSMHTIEGLKQANTGDFHDMTPSRSNCIIRRYSIIQL